MKLILAAALTLLTAGVAQAQNAEDKRFYAGVTGGVDIADDQTLNGLTVANGRRDIEVSYDNGSYAAAYLGVVAIERDWGRIRLDAEVSLRQSDVDALVLNDVSREVIGGSETSAAAGLINIHYDTPQFFDRVRFSGGAGIGIAGVDNEILYIVNNPGANNGGRQSVVLPTSEVTSAWQVAGGFELQITPSFTLVAEAKYFELGDYQVQRFILNTPGVGAGSNGTLDSVLNGEWSTTSVSVGVRYSF